MRKLLVVLTGLTWLTGAVIFFGRSPLTPPTHTTLVELPPTRCRHCTPNGELFKNDNACPPNPNARLFKPAIKSQGKTSYSLIPQIETDTLIFREIHDDELTQLHALMKDPTAVGRSHHDTHRFIEQTAALLGTIKRGYEVGDTVPWAVVDKRSNAFVGIAGFESWWPDRKEAGRKHMVGGRITTQVIVPRSKAQYEHEIYRALIQFVMTHPIFKVRRVEAVARTTDKIRKKSLELAGMMHEGTLRSYHRVNGQPIDFEQYAISKRDIEDKLE